MLLACWKLGFLNLIPAGHYASEYNYCLTSSLPSVIPSSFIQWIYPTILCFSILISSFCLTYTWHIWSSLICPRSDIHAYTNATHILRMSMAFLRNIFGYTSSTCTLLSDNTTQALALCSHEFILICVAFGIDSLFVFLSSRHMLNTYHTLGTISSLG